MKINLRNKSALAFLLMLVCFIHLPIVFASPKDVNINLLRLDKSNNLLSVSSLDNDNFLLNNIYDHLQLDGKGLSRKVFEYAVKGFNKIRTAGAIDNGNILSIVDFSKPSSQKRLFVIDIKNSKLLFNTYVAHGIRSGKAIASAFSNAMESNKSSIGFYKTTDTYMGKHGYSMRLMGLEKGFNDNAYKRDIVMHAADYVNEGVIRSNGFIGRSWGCPAVPENLNRPIIEKIKNGTCLFIFGTDKKYLLRSAMLRENVHDLAIK
jgi:L,D-transpeptidase catalytic domain